MSSPNAERYILAFIIGMLSIAGVGWLLYNEKKRKEEADGLSGVERDLRAAGGHFQAARHEMGI